MAILPFFFKTTNFIHGFIVVILKLKYVDHFSENMKIFLRFFTIAALLIVSIDAISIPFQPTTDGLAKAEYVMSAYTIRKDEHVTSAKDIVPAIDPDSSLKLINARYEAAVERLKQQAGSIKKYAKANQFNTEYCFLVDMSIPSGKNRFFVYNMKKDSIESSSLVAHGWGSQKTDSDQLAFSNVPNSCQTSLGKYRIGYSYNGSFGLAYKLYGLDNTNSKAFERAIVLHSLSHFPDSETWPDQIPQSAGCPMVSRSFLDVLGKYIKPSKKPVLLWIYN